MTQTLWIPLPLPGLNEIIDAASDAVRLKNGRVLRGVKRNDLKRSVQSIIALHARSQGFRRIESPAHFEFEYREPNRRRDPDNVSAGARKFVLDALQEAGLLGGDGWNEIASFVDTWKVDKQAPGVMVTVREEGKAA